MKPERRFRLLLIVAVAIVTIVSCGPRGKGVRVGIVSADKAGINKANGDFAKCAETIPSQYAVKVGSSRTDKDNKSVKAPICELPAEDSDTAKAERNMAEVFYRVGNDNGRLQVSLNIGLSFPEDFYDTKAKERVLTVLTSQCMPAIYDLWDRSQAGVVLDLNFHSSEDELASVDQYLVLVPMDPAELPKPKPIRGVLPETVLTSAAVNAVRNSDRQEPPKGLFKIYRDPQASFLDLEEEARQRTLCQKQGLAPHEIADCKRKAFWNSQENAKFCKAVASVVAHWLNLPSRQAMFNKCDLPPVPNPVLTEDKMSFQDFMITELKKTEPKPSQRQRSNHIYAEDEFWRKARFSKDDLATILKPACKSLGGNPVIIKKSDAEALRQAQ